MIPPPPDDPRRRSDLIALAVLSIAWLTVVALVGLGGDFALNDDWAYGWSARHFAATGEIRILDWAAPSLITHIAWGAALLKTFGDSYVVLRVGTLVWSLAALYLSYALSRRAGLDPRRAVAVALALGGSPWFVNLAFTYMSDVPWMTLMLAAMLVFGCSLSDATGPRRPLGSWLLLLFSGVLLGLAALIRQFSVITAPAFVLVAALEARRLGAEGWLRRAAVRAATFALPVVALYGPFQYWYMHIHGETLAHRQTLNNIVNLPLTDPLCHLIEGFHYLGLWLFPLAMVLIVRRELGQVVSRVQAAVAVAVLFVYQCITAWDEFLRHHHTTLPGLARHYAMPYFPNIVSVAGTGPPTIYDVYMGDAPMPHTAAWLPILLNAMSLIGGMVAVGILGRAFRTAWGHFRRPEQASRATALRTLLFAVSGLYLLWHVATDRVVFDRYLLPVLPVLWLLALDAAPPAASRSPWLIGLLLSIGALSIAGTHEYLSWNGARDRAVKQLAADGVTPDDVDGGFEVNGPRHFARYFAEHHQLEMPGGYWVSGAHYRISFWPSRTSACTTLRSHPYWTWPGGGERAIYVLHCD